MREKHVPLRTCVACRTKRPQRELVRLVRTDKGEYQIEPPRSAPGRGLYLCRRQQCWVDGVERGRIARAARAPIDSRNAATLIAWARNSLPAA